MSGPTEEPVVMTLVGDLVALGPIRRDLLSTYVRWWNDPEITLPLTACVWPTTLAEQEDWYEQHAQRGDGTNIQFLVYELGTGRPLGLVSLFDVNYRNQTASASSFIGERDCWGRGYATEARTLLLRYAFGPLGLSNVMVAIHADNLASLRVAEKVGYKRIGVQRRGIRRGGQTVDLVLLDILAEDLASALATEDAHDDT